MIRADKLPKCADKLSTLRRISDGMNVAVGFNPRKMHRTDRVALADD
jgi:hypothetical protein